MRFTKSLAVLFALALVFGCSKRELDTAPIIGLQDGQVAAPDTTPKPPHPNPPNDTTGVRPAVFISSDSTLAGTTGISRWQLNNTGRGSVLVQWTLTNTEGWPGYPITGSVRIRGRSELLEIPTPVPASTFTGAYTLLLEVTTATDPWIAVGYIGVYGNDPPPPPPPPPPAVVFAGSDSVEAGQSGATRWQLTNESNHPFTMNWTLGGQNWPGLPQQGSVDLQALEQRLLEVQVAVPDSVAPGYKFLEMVVTRPDTLPPASSPGFLWVVP